MFKAVLLKLGQGEGSRSCRVTGGFAESAWFLVLMLDLLRQKLWGCHPARRVVFLISPGDCDAHSRWRTACFLPAVSLHLPLSGSGKSYFTLQVTWSSPEDDDGKSHPTPFNPAWLNWVPLLVSQSTWHMFSHGSDEINCTLAAHLTTCFPQHLWSPEGRFFFFF